MTKPRRPVDIYIRVSRRGAREHFIAPEEQDRTARAFAEAEGIKLSGVVLEDIDRSGGTLDRPGLAKARDRVARGESGGIIFANLARLSRETEQGLSLLREITNAGGVVYAPNLPDYTTADGKMLTTIQLAIDSGYRERKAEEFERAKERAIANGIPVKPRLPVGYRARPDRHLEPDPRIAPVVREVFERRAAGEGPAALGAFLTASGVKTSQASRTWSKQAVYNLLKNRVYVGELVYGRDRRFVNPAAHEAIVDEALWQAAQQPNGQRRLAPPRTEGSEFILTGVLRCGGCRYCLAATTSSHGHRIYRCSRTRAGGICPAPARIRAEPVEAAAVEAFWAVTDNVEAEGREDNSGEVEALRARLAAVRAKRQPFEDPDYVALLGVEAAKRALARVDEEIAGLEAELARIEPRTVALPDAETLRGAWDRMGAQERRQLLALRFDCVALHRDKTLVVYPAGTGPDDLPHRGFTRAPVLAGFPDPPDGARLLALEERRQEPSHVVV